MLAVVALAYGQDTGIVKEILVTGNKTVAKDAILALMTTKIGVPYTQAKIDADKAAIEDLGFFSAVDVRGVPVDQTDRGNNWQVLVNVQEFSLIKEIHVSGNTVVSTEDILKVLTPGMKPGKLFNVRESRPSGRAVEKLYTDKGFRGFVTDFAPDPTNPSVVNLTILELRINSVSVQGNRLTKDWVMRRLIRSRKGDVYSAEKWFRDLSRVRDTGWFEPDKIQQLDELAPDGTVNLTADLVEARTGTFNIGVQVDPRSSFAGIISYRQANIGGTGQTVGLNFTQATQGQGPSIDLDYSNPYIDSKDTSIRAALFSRVLFRFQGSLFGGGGTSFTNDNQYTERRTGGSFGIARPQTDILTLGASLRVEEVKTENLKDLKDSNGIPIKNFIQQDGLVNVATLGATWNRRDSTIDPTRGSFVQIQVEPGYADINRVGGQTSDQQFLGGNFFVKVGGEYRTYFSAGKPRDARNPLAPKKVLAFRTRLSTIIGKVPFFEQYFAGGVESIRGYQEDRYWGKNQFISSLEYRMPIQSNFSLITFLDYGGAWGGYGSVNDFTQSDKFKLHLGYGPGISFRSPLGNIQVYIGFNEDGKSRTGFFIGNSF